ncbi:MAG: PQQ-dependent sugar dehydrogenase, partial [Cyanobacteria bacterium P01_H01_bin.153]
MNRQSPKLRQGYPLMTAGVAIALFSLVGCAAQPESAPAISTSQTPDTSEALDIADESQSRDRDFQIVTVVENLAHPWGVTWLPEGDLLITERSGQVRIVQDGVLHPTPISGVPDIFAQGQGGLLDVALHPDFAENRRVYFTYSQGTTDANRTQIARATFDGSALSNWQVIFEVSQTKPRGQHFGSRLTWLPDGTLLASIGDGGNPPISLEDEFIRQQAQNL